MARLDYEAPRNPSIKPAPYHGRAETWRSLVSFEPWPIPTHGQGSPYWSGLVIWAPVRITVCFRKWLLK